MDRTEEQVVTERIEEQLTARNTEKNGWTSPLLGMMFVVSVIATGMFVGVRGHDTLASQNGQVSVTVTSGGTARPAPSAVAWQPTYEEAWAAAYNQKKPLMLTFYTDWCGFCKQMDAETYTNPNVIGESGNFVSVKINAEQRTDLAQQYGVSGFPTTVVVDNRGQVLDNAAGFMGAGEFTQWMRSVRTKYMPL